MAVTAAAIAATALGLGTAPRPTQQSVELARSTGTLAISDSLAGGAILTASGMRPGSQAGGNVTISNRGTADGALTVAPAGVIDLPGPGGGPLSRRLTLTIAD